MDYIKNTLLANEDIIYYAKPHWIIFTRSVATLLLSLVFFTEGPYIYFLAQNAVLLNIPTYLIFTFIFLGCGLYFGINELIYYKFSEYGITNKRILIKTGWISRYSLEILLKKVEGIEISQSIPGRFLNYGTVVIRGIGGSRDIFPYVPKPILFRNSAQKQVEQKS